VILGVTEERRQLLAHERVDGCEGQQILGPVGWMYTAPAVDRVGLYRCITPAASG